MDDFMPWKGEITTFSGVIHNFLKDKSSVDKIIVKKQPYQLMNTNREFFLKDISGVDEIIVKKQPYRLLNTDREFSTSFDASNFHELVNETFKSGRQISQLFCILYECAKARSDQREVTS